MPERFRKLIAAAAILLGTAHLIYGALAYRSLSPEHIWFAGAGVAMICVGVTNFRQPARFEAGILSIYIAIMASQIPLPQVFLGLALFGLLTLPNLTKRKV